MSTLGGGLPAIPLGAVLYQRAVSNAIGVTAASSKSIGYLATNRTQLEVVSQLTGQDATNIFNFTFQNTGKVKITVLNIDDGSGTKPPASVHFQLYDGSGTRLLADNQGTKALQTAFENLTKSPGLDLKQGKYVVKVTYGKDGDKKKDQNYAVQVNSGTTFKSDYRTLASAMTVQNTLLAGGNLGYNSLSTTAAMLTDVSYGNTLDIFGSLSLFQTNIFA